MPNRHALVIALLLGALAMPCTSRASAQTLAVKNADGWHTWWDVQHAPARWVASLPALGDAVAWHTARHGLEWGEIELSAPGEGWRTKTVLVRVDPRKYRFALEAAIGDGGTTARWTVDTADTAASFAVNAGQFEGASPWGWVVHGGREARPPRSGPLSSAVVFEAAGAATIVDAQSIAAVRSSGDVQEAFQSYPTLLVGDGDVPAALRTGENIDVTHRDARLAVGELRDGRLLFVLTRFAGLGGVASSVPLGLTVPEMAALMGALGCRRAVSLDGGLSSQLLVRDDKGRIHGWRGWRKVPMGLVAIQRAGN